MPTKPTKSYSICLADISKPFNSYLPTKVLLSGFPSIDACDRYLAKNGAALGIRSIPDRVRIFIQEVQDRPTRDRNGKLIHYHSTAARAKISAALSELRRGGLTQSHRDNIAATQHRRHLENQRKLEELERLQKQVAMLNR